MWAFSGCGKPRLRSGCGEWASPCGGFSCFGARALQGADSVLVAHRLSCSEACGIFPDRGLNLLPLHCEVDSYPLDHKGSHHIYHFSVTLERRKMAGERAVIACSAPFPSARSFNEILTAFSAIRVPLGLTYLCIYQYLARESHTEPGTKDVLRNSWSNWAALN